MAVLGQSTVYTLFSSTAKWQTEALAIECGDRHWTYGQLLDTVDRMATVLASHGIEPGDRIAILSQNCAEYTLLQLASGRIGAIVSCLNWRPALNPINGFLSRTLRVGFCC